MTERRIILSTSQRFIASKALMLRFSSMVLYVRTKCRAYQGRGNNGIRNEIPGLPPCSHST